KSSHVFFQAEDGIRDFHVTGAQTCALPILENYNRIFTADEKFVQSVKITFYYVLASVPLKLIAALLVAMLLNKAVRGISVYRTADRKSTRLNSSHVKISYAVFCLKKKTKTG